jgi:two-component system, cell cycle response regulator DivK
VANELILIVEDNDKNRKLVRDVLQFKGYRLAEAETGEEGVRLAHELHPDLILMDIQLPGIDGATALRQLRGDPATQMIPALAVTASAMTQDRQTIMGAGFEGYQSKPLNMKAFLEAVRQVLDRTSEQRGH